jgi:nitrate/nitrite transporter NarK
LPYVAVFLKQEGMGPEKIGIISGFRPFIGFISAPLLGICGDRYGKRRCILLVSIVAWLMFYVALYHVPAPVRKSSCPKNLVPHRHHSSSRALRSIADAAVDPGLVAPDLPSDTQELLQENIEWLYVPQSLQVIFIVTFCLIVAGEVFQSPTTAMSDAGTLRTLGSERLHEYGAQRAWGSVGWGLR